MPRRIVTSDGSRFEIVEYELPPPGPRDVRVRVAFAAPKHGTESHIIGGSVQDRKRWDPELRLFLDRGADDPQPAPPAQRGIGNAVVGTVTAVGAEVTRVKVGDRVFGGGQIREEHQAPEGNWYPLGEMAPEDAVCVDPAHVAFVAIRDGNIRIGDSVAIFGLGAIGMMAVQVARASGARHVFAVDPIALRRERAAAFGADAAFDPRDGDVALAIKRATANRGVDVSVETSGSGRALNDAIRCIQQCGTVVHVPWGPKDASQLHLDEEWHLNRPTLVGSQAWEGWGSADRSYPLWTHQRAYDAAIDLLRRGVITGKGVVTPVVSFEEAPEALARIFSAPETTIKVGVALE